MNAFDVWDCYQLQDVPGMGGSLTHTGIDGVAVVDAGGTPYTAYGVWKRLFPENPGGCGVTFADRLQLWLQKGTTVSAANQVCIDSTGSLLGCVNVSDLGLHVTLVRTPDGRIHALYFDGVTGLRYAVSDAAVTSFTSEPVLPANASNGGGDLSLAIDSSGEPHITYVWNQQFYYARRSGGTWSSVVLAVPAFPQGYAGARLTNASLKLDSSGLASIAFTVDQTLWYARETSSLTFATAEIAYSAADLEGYPSLARASNGDVHVSYFVDSGSQIEHVYHVKRTSTGWGTPTLVATYASSLGAYPGKRMAIALTSGATQLPRIAYPDPVPGGGYGVWLSAFDGSGWSSTLAVPCPSPPPPPPGDGGGGGGGGRETDPVTYGRSPEEVGNACWMVSPSVLHASSPVQLRICTLQAASLKLDILDVAGRISDSERIPLTFGFNTVQSRNVHLPPGVYMVRASIPGVIERTFRIAVLR